LAIKSGDAEVARRAREILETLDRKERERAFVKFADLAKQGAIDQVVERFVRREKWDDETACWQVLAELAGRLTDLEKKTYGSAGLPALDTVPARDFRRYAATLSRQGYDFKILSDPRPSPAEVRRCRAIRSEELTARATLGNCLIASSGQVKAGPIHQSVIFAGESVEAGDVSQSLIVCDGDFTARTDIVNCLIIARGSIRCPSMVTNSRLIAGGEVRYAKAEDLLDTKVREKEPNPLGFVTFFDPAKAGLAVETAEGGVRVKAADKDKPFARAGLRADDLVLTLDGTAAKDAETFRRLLRAKLAVPGEMTFKVRRGDKALDITVPHKD
jgi:hypothetical protein